MKNHKLIDSIDQLSDRYIEEALDTPIRIAQTSNMKMRSKAHLFPRKLITAAAMLCIGLGIGYVTQNVLPDTPSAPQQISQKPTSTPNKKSSIFSPLTVTAYAAERSDNTFDEGITLPENVPIILSEYSPLMSSVPAMPFSFSYEKESTDGEIHFVVRADPMGSLQKYQQLSGIWELAEESKSLECKPNEKIYWQPSSYFQAASEGKLDKNQQDTTDETKGEFSWGVGMEPETPNNTANPEAIYPSDKEWINSNTLGADSIITVEVYEDETLLETQYIGISYQNSQYTATLKLSVSAEERYEYDDIIITSKGYETTDEEVNKKVLDALSDPDRLPPGGQAASVGHGGQAGEPSSQASGGSAPGESSGQSSSDSDDEDEEIEIDAE